MLARRTLQADMVELVQLADEPLGFIAQERAERDAALVGGRRPPREAGGITLRSHPGAWGGRTWDTPVRTALRTCLGLSCAHSTACACRAGTELGLFLTRACAVPLPTCRQAYRTAVLTGKVACKSCPYLKLAALPLMCPLQRMSDRMNRKLDKQRKRMKDSKVR